MAATAKSAVKKDLVGHGKNKDLTENKNILEIESEAFFISSTTRAPENPIRHIDVEYLTTKHAAIRQIDDSVVMGLNLAKFRDIRFTWGKKISLFFQHTFPLIVQSIFVPIFHVIYRCFFVIDIKGKENLENVKGPVLFISNHVGIYDSFMFDLFVKPFSHILPFRFMGAKVFLSPFLSTLKFIGIVDLVYFFFGVFRVTRGEGAEKSLKKAYEIIKDGGTVAMYPEGKIWRPTAVHPERIGPFKWGAAILAKNTNVQVVPVSLKRIENEFRFRDDMKIIIGEPFYVSQDMAPEEIADEMRLKILDLYNQSEE